MKYTRTDYERFLEAELRIQIQEYEQLITTKASVLKERGEVFVGQFLKLNESGIAIFKMRYSDIMPRKNSFWMAVLLDGDKGSYKNWGDNEWKDLRRNHQLDFSEAYCVFLSKTDDPQFCLIGIKGLSIEFVQKIEAGKTIIAFGPKEPPLRYLVNLIGIVRDTDCKKTKFILDYEEKENLWNPIKVEAKENFTEILLNEMKKNDYIMVQGPPGTGKTYRMAQLVAHLLKENKSVLVTALTNQALIELAKKEDLQAFIKNGKVSKTSLTTDEQKELPSLEPIRENLCNASNGALSLATFYIASGWAKDTQEIPFDYVIMDEASQAFFPMIAAVLKLGKKVIWIGDQNQLSPIVLTNEDVINEKGYLAIVKGFNTLCENFSYKSYVFSDTFRLTKRGADFTGIFYDNILHSVAEKQHIDTQISCLNKEGGPSLVSLELEIGNKTPHNAFDVIHKLTQDILKENPKATIAILSKFVDSVRALQKTFAGNTNENIKIETVDRVQGLTVDYCIFFIPNASTIYSLDKELFNVATSRARFCTVIVADKYLLNNNMDLNVRKYLLKTQEDKFVSFQPKTISSKNMSVSIIDKIDLTTPEKKKNTYIVDTNIFVDDPDVISKIGTHNRIVIPAKVLEELDKLKLNGKVDNHIINKAARNINQAFGKNRSQMEEADISLLPVGFDKKNPDCMILSVALKFKNENPILLTSDNILQTRAQGLGIRAIPLKDLK